MPKVLRAKNMSQCIGCYSCMLACARHVAKSFSPRQSAIQIRTHGGLQSRLMAVVCSACHNPACARACHFGALTPRTGGGVTLHPDACIGCGRCVEACTAKAIFLDDETRKPIVCRHCGICTQFCPHHLLSLEEAQS